ncbi:nitroreductase family protein [Variovorax soli]|uniref:SagB-type dehydrogenase family enzyme n=1 Tax=Variovorax soli TaxID=376815 RepID=A0ABU1NKY7_9BURK|nr:nitroreductase family protein [Variovorax soli]MDR6539104.1 SagB-type dehydrogenase family enzyme [Variovorax soli]
MSTIPLNLESDIVVLPYPALSQHLSLDQAFKKRCSTRAFLDDTLTLDAMSALLWAAFGVNREQQGGRTAPSAHGWKEIDIYVVLAEGAYRYEPRMHRLLLVRAEDVRKCAGTQDFVAAAPVNLVYVADLARMVEVREEDRPFLAGADAGCIAQNVYLYCAAAGLATVVRALIDRRRLAHALGLPINQRITLAQTVGYAKL